ncbi:MAG: 2-dehydropantoate 2-reductase, partial [Actinomycetia bacterium]|nr:2-dehydropantoate 2-reductase [Actinomycetes bacterium]
MSPAALSVAVVGPGAIGLTALTALLDRGHDVVVCARSPFDRVRYRGPDGERTHEVRVLTDPASVSGPVDLVVVATKAHQVDGAAGWLGPLAGDHSVVAVLQNGIEHRQRVAPYVGRAAVAPAVVNLPAEREAPGEVVVEARSSLTVPDDEAGRIVAEA